MIYRKTICYPSLYTGIFLICLLVTIFSCEKLELNRVTKIQTGSIIDTTQTSCSAQGSVIEIGVGGIIQYGHCWSTTTNPSTSDSITQLGSRSSTGSFNSSLTGLTSNTKYYVRAYTVDGKGTTFGKEVNFTTLPVTIPSVTTSSVNNIFTDSATCGGNVTDDGGASVTARGVCWSTSQNPTVADSHTTDSSGTGSFASSLTGLAPNITYYIRAYATNSAGTAYGNQESFTTNQIPTATTNPATNIGVTTVTLNGTVNANGQSTTVTFEYGTTTSYGSIVTASQSPVTGSTNTSVSAAVTGLTANTTYNFCVKAVSAAGTDYGSDQAFTTTTVQPPTATTNAATNVAVTSATLNGTVNDNGLSTTVTFEFGTTTSYGSTVTANQSPVTGSTGTSVSADISGLTENTTYHFRVKAESTAGTTYGSDQTFSTTTLLAPIATTNAATNIAITTATLNGTVNANGQSTTVTFEFGTTTSYGSTVTANQSPVTGSVSTSVSADISGLTGNTTYHFRVKSVSAEGTTYGDDQSFTTSTPGPCSDFEVTHTAGNVAPVSKTVTYRTIETDLSGENVCWITQNLGADNQAASATDDSEAAAGWYWQFNRKQGYKHDGDTRTPGTTWITSIDEDNNWTAANDPCILLLGMDWRLPTYSEWTNVDYNGGWNNYNDPYTSVLKLHTAGLLFDNSGSLSGRGVGGAGSYWSSNQITSTIGQGLTFDFSSSEASNIGKEYGFSIRCLKAETSTLPTLTTTAVTSITATTASSGGNITDDGGTTVTARGVCWSTGANPTTADSKTSDGTGMGSFTSSITGLTPGILYYVRAYATNSAGTAYGNELSFTTSAPCTNFEVTHTAGDVAPVSKTVTYGTVETDLSGETKCWITQNLGADIQAGSATDATESAAGWYWQFNLKQGYQHDGTTRTPSTTWTPSRDEDSDWTAANDPCTILLGTGWRIPTETEWTNADNNGGWSNYIDTYASVLKLHAAGYLYHSDGSLYLRGNNGQYWSSIQYYYLKGNGYYLYFSSNYSRKDHDNKASGFSVRCLRD